MTITARQSAGLVASSAVAAASTLLITIIAARSTDDGAAFREFTVYWSVFFAAVGVITGVQQEATRATASAEHRAGARLVTIAALVGTLAALCMAGLLLFAHARLLPLTDFPTLVALTVGIIVMALYQTLMGCAAGHRRWWSLSVLISADAVARIALVAAAALVVGSLVGLQWAVVLAGLSWVPFLLGQGFRRLFLSRGDASTGVLLRNSAWTLLSAAALATLTTGFPAMLQATAPHVEARRLAMVMTLVTVTRSALLLPLQAFQGVILTRFRDAGAARLPQELLRFVLLAGGLGIVAAVPAWFLGPPVIEALFGAMYRPGPALVTGLWLAAVPLGWLLLTGQAALAQSQHRSYAAGWVIAAVATMVGLFLPSPLEVRVIVALIAGPVIGATVQVLPLLIRRRRDAAGSRFRHGTAR